MSRMSEHWADQQNESGMDAGERHHFDEHDSPWDAFDAPMFLVCQSCGYTFRDDELECPHSDSPPGCPECGSDDFLEMED